MIVGRNDPCPCGSGMKFKRCCGAPKTDPMERAAGAIRAVQASAEAKVARLLRAELGDDAIHDAWEDFDLTERGLDPDREEADLFSSWTLYDWEPWESTDASKRPKHLRLTPAGLSLAGRGSALSPAESEFLIDVLTTPMSFHDVVACEPGRTMTLRDILLDATVTVFERSGSSTLRPGDILYARAVSFDDVALLIGSGELVIPPGSKGAILDAKRSLRTWLRRPTSESLCRKEPTLRGLYFEIRGAILDPALPNIANTDGEPLEFHTLVYRIESAEEAFAALAPLAGDVDRESLLAEADRNRDGSLRRAELTWTRDGNAKHGGLPNTTVATFTIDTSSLTVEVNSAARAEAAREEIAKRLGKRATFLRDDAKAVEQALAERRGRPETAKERAARKQDEELQALPEIQEMLAKFTADHYATWPDVPLPALKGKTPRDAVRTKEGRERVEALVADFERKQADGRLKLPHYDFNQLRGALGLPRREP